MLSSQHRGAVARRATVAVLATLSLLLSGSFVAGTNASAAGASAGYDSVLDSGKCDLLGRAFVKGQGCSRTKCVPGAKMFRKVFGAEACQLRGQGELGFVSTIDSRRCSALHRRWIAQVNYCASYPDRSASAVYNAPQCTSPHSVYVLLEETEGFNDECMTPARVRELIRLAREEGSDLHGETALRSAAQCPDRPGMLFAGGKCVTDPGSPPTRGGVLMVGDSLTWRGTDELGRLRPTFEIDGEPARQLTTLQSRVDYYRAVHGDPTGVIIALGAVAPPASFTQADLARVVRSVPRSADVMLVLPFAQLASNPAKQAPVTVKVGGWMRAIARSRPGACIADWPAYVKPKAGILQDGVHVKHSAEGVWAKFISQQWSRC